MTKLTEDDFNESELFTAPIAKLIEAEAAKASNPLAGFFRLPGLSVKLPTNGVFFPEGGIEFDENGEVTVLPMKAADELMLSSPDALMNNTAIINLIESCVPQIKMPSMVSSPDLDVLLLAIRVASNGEDMESEAECPECGETNNFLINIPTVLQSMQEIPAVNQVRASANMVVYLKPHTIATQSKILNMVFRETREAQALDVNVGLSDDERAVAMDRIMKGLAAINLFGVEQSVTKIVIPNAEVTDRNHIHEFINNTDRTTLGKIRDAVEKLNSMGVDKNVSVECAHCKHTWNTEIEFNPSTFFAERSSD